MRKLSIGFLTILLMASPAIASADEACSTYGINAHLPSPAQLDMIKAAGFNWVRFDFNWKDMEPQQDQFVWGPWDNAVNHAHSIGLNVFATMAYTPKWASADPGCTDCGPTPFANPADWADYVTKTVNRYKGKVKYWGLWNEPNLEHFYTGTLDQFVNDILIPGAQALKAADPNGLVLGPELAGLTKSSNWNGDNGTCVFGKCVLNGWEIDLAEVLKKGGGHIDIVTHHFYDDNADKLVGLVLDGESDFGVKTHSSLKEIIEQHSPGKEVWLTEWGWNTTPYGGYNGDGQTSEPDQAKWSKETWEQLAVAQTGWPALTKLFLYDFHDGEFEGKLWAFGIVRADGTPKPTYDTLKAYFGANPPQCGAVDPDPDPDPDPVEPDPQSKPSYAAPYLAGTSDGTLDEWGVAPIVELSPGTDWASIAGASPSNSSDLSADVQLAWSDGYLRIGVLVNDDAHHPNTTGGQYWNGDNIQIAVDPMHDQKAGGYADDDWEIGVSQNGIDTLIECYQDPLGGCLVVASAVRSGSQTLYEVEIPLDAKTGLSIGVNLIVNEDDGSGREGWLEWTPGIGFEKNPSAFAQVTLVGEPPIDQPGTTGEDPDPGTTGAETTTTGTDPDPTGTTDTGETTGDGEPATTGGGETTGDGNAGGGSGEGTSQPVGITPDPTTGDGVPNGGEVADSAEGCTASARAPSVPSAIWLALLFGLAVLRFRRPD